MRKDTIIEHDIFKQIIQYKEAVTGSVARNHLKMEMLNSIISAIGEKWNRMKEETKSALEYLCFLSIEKGFVYCSPEHIGGRYDVNSNTMRAYYTQLEKMGVIKRKWRSSTKHNGRGCVILFFTAHPYYSKYWLNQFFLDNEMDADLKAETINDSSYINENERIIDSTTTKPNIFKRFKERTKENPVRKDKPSFIPNWVNKEFAHLAAYYFPEQQITELWRISFINAKKFNIPSQDLIRLSVSALKLLIGKIKGKRPVRNPMGYFTGVISQQMKKEYLSDLFISVFDN